MGSTLRTRVKFSGNLSLQKSRTFIPTVSSTGLWYSLETFSFCFDIARGKAQPGLKPVPSRTKASFGSRLFYTISLHRVRGHSSCSVSARQKQSSSCGIFRCFLRLGLTEHHYQHKGYSQDEGIV